MHLSVIRKYYPYFIYLSILFFVVYLVRQDHVTFSNLRIHPWQLVSSILLLWAGFFISTQSWRKALTVHGIRKEWKETLYSHGIAIFGKYIPGKIWVILGRAFPVTEGKQALQVATLASLKEQLLYLFLGLLISLFPVIFLYPTGMITLILAITILLLGLFLFVPGIHHLTIRLISRIIRKKVTLPVISFHQSLQMGTVILLYWICWITAFYLFLNAVSDNITVLQAFAFPLSVCYGVMAIIFPGGLGIREGIMTGFLVLTGMSPETAAVIALVNRLWFITGELFLFFTALLLRPAKITS